MVTNGYPDYPGSYRGIFIKKLCLALKKEGLDIVVLCPRVFKRSPFFELDEDIPVHRFWYPSGEKPLGQSGRVPKFRMVAYMISGFFAALKLIIIEKPDIIHGNWIVPTGLIAAISGKLTGKPVMNSVRGMDYRIAENRLIKPLFKLAALLSDRITVVSESMKSNRALACAEIVSSGVDDRFFEVNSSSDSKTIISTRSLEPIYDVETLIRAVPLVLARESEAKFIIIGGGSLSDQLQNLAAELGVSERITFTGQIDNSEIPKYMEKAKVYVSTSLADGTSVSLLEALAAGLVPVVTDIEANRPFINEKGLFKKGDFNELSCAILTALNDTSTLDSEAEINKNVSWPAIAQKYLHLYNQLADKTL
jgi:glycosyltransferase involved in cell wall biosynthesis